MDLKTLLAGTDNVKPIKWPGTDVTVNLRVLNQQDLQEASFATEKLFLAQKLPYNTWMYDTYSGEQETQVLYRALRNPENDQPLWPSITEFRKALTYETKKLLCVEYKAHETECSPNPNELSADEFDRLTQDLKKKPEEIIGACTNISTLKRLLLFTVCPPVNSPQGNGSL
jgi:hypothetical protein